MCCHITIRLELRIKLKPVWFPAPSMGLDIKSVSCAGIFLLWQLRHAWCDYWFSLSSAQSLKKWEYIAQNTLLRFHTKPQQIPLLIGPKFTVKGTTHNVMKMLLSVRWPLSSSKWRRKQPAETEACSGHCFPIMKTVSLGLVSMRSYC